MNLTTLVHNARMGDSEVMELEIANGFLPRVKLEYDRLNDEMS